MNYINNLQNKSNKIKHDKKYRKAILISIYNWIKNNIDEIEKSLFLDLHKPKTESYLSEIQIVLKEIRIQLSLLNYAFKKHRVNPFSIAQPLNWKINSKYYKYEPKGIVFIIGPFNYPFHLVLMPLIGAVAAGNKALIKVSEKTKNTAEIIEKMIKETLLKDVCISIEHDCDIATINEQIESKPDLIFFLQEVNL
ncbi:aldehyde dehydrogenase family protein [Mycoplasma phocoenae]|uniref:aldehyde dehydrogenase family protein n=1 Tax=Mycoplasma phocoenae TaxID=754517 RepID=UPI002350E3FA|nr:aldehyde dehydrogenase family protein [Mycoplasma phocoenae]